MITAAKISHLWNATMALSNFERYGASTSSFNDVHYAYTKDATGEAMAFGEMFMQKLRGSLIDDDDTFTRICRGKPADLRTITRDQTLWNK